LSESAISRVPLASEEARGIEPLNHNHFDEVILGRGCTLTYSSTLNKQLKIRPNHDHPTATATASASMARTIAMKAASSKSDVSHIIAPRISAVATS
jgi:hypothetical protein